MQPNLLRASIAIILENQAPAGSYVACPNFPIYQYCWFRDGAYTAYAMNLVGEHASARRFHTWCAATILRHAEQALRAIEKARHHLPLGADYLHTRYTLEGEEGRSEGWANFQLDGFGTWLWAVGEHLHKSGDTLPGDWQQAGELAAAYLGALWSYPCYDCWEERPGMIHPHTLAAIYGGLMAYSHWGGNPAFAQLAQGIRDFLLNRAVHAGYFVKYLGAEDVDASLLGLAVPYGVVAAEDPLMQATVRRIEQRLRVPRGGVHRYATDTYYGGGEWILLAGWLGWYYAEVGEDARALELLTWMEAQADSAGQLPEQVPANLIAPSFYRPWVERWGPIATPLLWSHAKYLILYQALKRYRGTGDSTHGER
ncbi:glycoside hydrolase family 15 protein [uncultured Thermanaerothrix sp.]|uniref:glycoside hydrolase family 15 protein n=1 Tax=uncultured Thermanaerothrix sp. TaxID=1195149 RepID=UPI002608C0F3|nr:glycoside hydrolase family 15 protein [uncultured Thermanaerothrix sp.]